MWIFFGFWLIFRCGLLFSLYILVIFEILIVRFVSVGIKNSVKFLIWMIFKSFGDIVFDKFLNF